MSTLSTFEYKTICAPRKALKFKGVKGTEERYARTLTDVINTQAADGWEYLRAESLPVDEKIGLIGKTAERYFSLLVFRRENIETYEEPSFSGNVAAQPEAETIVIQAPAVNEEPRDEIASLGPATR